MRSAHPAMSWIEYERMPWKPGWKHEYWDGHAHITPRQHVVCVVRDVTPQASDAPCTLRPLMAEDREPLVSLFFQAFRDTIEYCDRSAASIREDSRRAIDGYFSGERGDPHASSRVAVSEGSIDRHDEIIGAALIVEPVPGQPVLDILFVSPLAQRSGVAGALARAVMNELHAAGFGTLESTYMMGNEASRAWHQKFGFVEEPDLRTAQLYYLHAQHEIQRHDALQHLSELETVELRRECERWKQEAERLERVAQEQGYEVTCPVLRRSDRRRTKAAVSP